MKRQAENQLTKDGRDGDSDDEGGEERGMKKASEAELGRRTIRPLPSRNRASMQPPVTTPSATTTGGSLFSSSSSFTSFMPGAMGNPTSSTSLFAGFGATPAAAEIVGSSTALPTSTGFSSTPPSNIFSTPFPSKPPSTPTATAKSFVTMLGNSSTSPLGVSAPAVSPPATSSPGKNQDDSKTVKYYKNLRGLNVSLLSSLNKFVQDDPYVDLTEALEKYKTFRTKVQAEFGEPSTGTSSKLTSQFTLPTTMPSTDPPSTVKPVVSAAMPAPPSSFTGFSGFKAMSGGSATPSSNASNFGGFKPSVSVFGSSSTPNAFSLPADTKSSGFTLPTEMKSSGFTHTTEPKSSGFTFSSSTPSTTITNTAPAPAAGFGASSTSSTTSSSVFGSPFGTSTTTPTNPFGAPSSTASSNFVFGKTAEKPESSVSNPFGIAEKSTITPSNFFSVPASTKSATSGSLFGFGSSSSPTPNPFSKLEERKPEPAASTEETGTEGEASERSTPAAEGDNTTPALLSANPLDEEGAGEENEETVHAIKAKAFKLSKDAEGAGKWLQLGTGMLRLKKDKESDARRILLRNSTNGKVIVNFRIYSAMKPTQSKSALSFIGHEDGAPVSYSIRLATEADAKNLKEVLDREIAAIKAKDS